MSNIKEIGLLIRGNRNNWQIHNIGEITSLGHVKDNPIQLGSLNFRYSTRNQVTKAVESIGYIVNPINSNESKIVVDFEDTEAIEKIAKALEC